MTDKELLEQAREAAKNSYSNYSHFRVGAALLSADGQVFLGCNIENASYSPTNCAERTAVFKAVSKGEREFAAIAIVGGPEKGPLVYATPCGVCRQVLSEFCPPDFRILLGQEDGDIREFTLKELLPESIDLISGPGCPVCVTAVGFIDEACWLALEKGCIICTFGDK